MAGIDKTYTKSYKNYKDLVDWASKNIFTCPNGMKINPSEYIYPWEEEDFIDNNNIPILNTTMQMDYYLIKYCPLDFVQERMKYVYDKEYYDSIKNGTSEFDTFTKEGKYGKHCKIINKPIISTKRPIGRNTWFVQVYPPEEYFFMSYNESCNKWLWPYELGEFTSNTCHKFKTIKSVIRNILKWQLPIGTIVTVESRYVGLDYKIKITK